MAFCSSSSDATLALYSHESGRTFTLKGAEHKGNARGSTRGKHEQGQAAKQSAQINKEVNAMMAKGKHKGKSKGEVQKAFFDEVKSGKRVTSLPQQAEEDNEDGSAQLNDSPFESDPNLDDNEEELLAAISCESVMYRSYTDGGRLADVPFGHCVLHVYRHTATGQHRLVVWQRCTDEELVDGTTTKLVDTYSLCELSSLKTYFESASIHYYLRRSSSRSALVCDFGAARGRGQFVREFIVKLRYLMQHPVFVQSDQHCTCIHIIQRLETQSEMDSQLIMQAADNDRLIEELTALEMVHSQCRAGMSEDPPTVPQYVPTPSSPAVPDADEPVFAADYSEQERQNMKWFLFLAPPSQRASLQRLGLLNHKQALYPPSFPPHLTLPAYKLPPRRLPQSRWWAGALVSCDNLVLDGDSTRDTGKFLDDYKIIRARLGIGDEQDASMQSTVDQFENSCLSLFRSLEFPTLHCAAADHQVLNVSFVYYLGHGYAPPLATMPPPPIRFPNERMRSDLGLARSDDDAASLFPPQSDFIGGEWYLHKYDVANLDAVLSLWLAGCRRFHQRWNHLILYLDSCYAAKWIDRLREIESYLPPGCHITIQASCKYIAYGAVFTPVFEAFNDQVWRQKALKEFQSFASRSGSQQRLRDLQLPTPEAYSTCPAVARELAESPLFDFYPVDLTAHIGPAESARRSRFVPWLFPSRTAAFYAFCVLKIKGKLSADSYGVPVFDIDSTRQWVVAQHKENSRQWNTHHRQYVHKRQADARIAPVQRNSPLHSIGAMLRTPRFRSLAILVLMVLTARKWMIIRKSVFGLWKWLVARQI